MAFLGLLSLQGVFSLVGLLLVLETLKILYRLTLHPLAKFPGPKLAAATSLYGLFYDISPDRSYVKELPAMHDKYGPIIRPWPHVLHIRDMESYNQVFRSGTKFNKDPVFYSSPIVAESLFNIHDTQPAKQRKDMFQPYFSKAAIRRLEVSVIQDMLSKFLGILGSASLTGRVVDLSEGYRCLTSDTIMQYCYQKPLGALDAPHFRFPLLVTMEDFLGTLPPTWYFPKTFGWLNDMLTMLPTSFIESQLGAVFAVQWLQRQCRDRVLALKAHKDLSQTSTPSIFDTMLHPDHEKGQYTPSDDGLQGDACLMFVAGTDTTANALVMATWGVLSNSQILRRLKTELLNAIPNKSGFVNWQELENIPYLRGVVKEALRFSYGVPGRISRVVPSSGATFCGESIPPGTTVAHSAYVYHQDEAAFADAATFNPDRWLAGNETELDGSMLSFSRGSRNCLGMNLALAEIYLTLGHLFRRYDLTLHDTTAKDMEWKDCFTPKTYGHLKVTIREAEK